MVHSQSLLAALVAIAVTSFALAIPIQGAAGVFSTQENAASTPGVPRTNFIPPPAPINSVYRRSVIVGEEAEDIDIDSGEESYWHQEHDDFRYNRYHHDDKIIPAHVKVLPEQLGSPHPVEEEVRLSLDISESPLRELSRRAGNSVGDKELSEAGELTYKDTKGFDHTIKLVGVQKLNPAGQQALKEFITSECTSSGGVLPEEKISRVYNQLTILLPWEVKFGLRIPRNVSGRLPSDDGSRKNGRERATYKEMISLPSNFPTELVSH
ncbi:hypothetical protein GG344DRAFT_71323 [Lentinula edodes]|nr:hypothetical protein GG344DRAFT_71323 [Lentinula edodes]